MSAPYMGDDPHCKMLEKLDKRLSEFKDDSQFPFRNVGDYRDILHFSMRSSETMELGVELIPRYYRFFTSLTARAFDSYKEIIHRVNPEVRVQAIHHLPQFSTDTPDFISEIIDVLVQCLDTEEEMEHVAVQQAFMSLFQKHKKASLTALFKYTEVTPTTDEQILQRVLDFIRDKVFPLIRELLKPQEEMERHIAYLIGKSLGVVTGEEFNMFMAFLRTLSIFESKAPQEIMQELVEILEGQADLDSQFDVSDTYHIDTFASCLQRALPFFARGIPGSKWLNYLNMNIMPAFGKLLKEKKLNFLRALAEMSPYMTAQEACQMLPSIILLLKNYMKRRKALNFTFVECLLYVFHHLAYKAPNATYNLCGFKRGTAQQSDISEEDALELSKDFRKRLNSVEKKSQKRIYSLAPELIEHDQAIFAAEKKEKASSIQGQKLSRPEKEKRQITKREFRTCNNILAMTKLLKSKTQFFMRDTNVKLSWKRGTKPLASKSHQRTMRKTPLTPDSLMRLPEDCKRTLAEYGFCHLDEECVNLLVDLPKLREAQCNLDSPFLLNDDGQVALLCCEEEEEEEEEVEVTL